MATLGVACNGGSDDVREWTASDHDQPERPTQQTTARAPSSAAPSGAPDPELVDLAWQRTCSRCHGPNGRGDGPEGPMVRPPDLTNAAWQDSVTDEQIATTIRKGKNKMPSFDLPDAVVQGLVARIRARRR